MAGLPFQLPSGLPTGEEIAGGGIVRTVTDSVGVADGTSRIHDAKRTPIETVGVVDSGEEIAGGGIVRTVTDSVGVADGTSRIHDAKRTPIETVGVADSTSSGRTVPLSGVGHASSEGTGVLGVYVLLGGVGHASCDGSAILNKHTSMSVDMSLDATVSLTLLQVGVVPIYATSGAGGGGAGRSSGGNRNRRLPKSRLVRR